MPSTHSSIQIHITFSTKERLPLIEKRWRNDLHGYIGGCLKQLEVVPQEIGGVEDHIHLLIGIKPVHAVADIIHEAKRISTRWVKSEVGVKRFAWQEGYGAFSVSKSSVPSVRRYIQNQERHHRRRTFQEEYREFLEKHEIEFDERYLW